MRRRLAPGILQTDPESKPVADTMLALCNPSVVSVAQFLSDLFESGRVSVFVDLPAAADRDTDEALMAAEKNAAANLAGPSPGLDIACAQWAAKMFYGACHFLVCRDVNAETIQTFFKQTCPQPHSPQTDYSVDLVFRYLPDLIRMTCAVAADDPLLQELIKLGKEWPLSSVGVGDIGPVHVRGFIGHAGLRQLYVDRIIAQTDITRLSDPSLDFPLTEALGDYPELCQPIAKHLNLPSLVHE